MAVYSGNGEGRRAAYAAILSRILSRPIRVAKRGAEYRNVQNLAFQTDLYIIADMEWLREDVSSDPAAVAENSPANHVPYLGAQMHQHR